LKCNCKETPCKHSSDVMAELKAQLDMNAEVLRLRSLSPIERMQMYFVARLTLWGIF
jgi:hypothetical protein